MPRLILAATIATTLMFTACGTDDDVTTTESEADPEADELADDLATSTTEPTTTTTSTEPTTTTTTTQPEPEPGPRGNPLPLGEVAQLEDYEAAVVAFTPDATSEIMAVNQFNDPPAAGSVYSLVRLSATYTGLAESFPFADLSVGHIGADSRVYDPLDCRAVVPDSLLDQPEVVMGGMVEGNVCLQLPQEVLGTGAVFVEPAFSFDGERAWWEAPA